MRQYTRSACAMQASEQVCASHRSQQLQYRFTLLVAQLTLVCALLYAGLLLLSLALPQPPAAAPATSLEVR